MSTEGLCFDVMEMQKMMDRRKRREAGLMGFSAAGAVIALLKLIILGWRLLRP